MQSVACEAWDVSSHGYIDIWSWYAPAELETERRDEVVRLLWLCGGRVHADQITL